MFLKLKDKNNVVMFVKFDIINNIVLKEDEHTLLLWCDDTYWEVQLSVNYRGILEDVVNNMIMLQASPIFDLTLYQKE